MKEKLLVFTGIVIFAAFSFLLPVFLAEKQAENPIPELKPGEKMAAFSGIGMF
ncbi:hypothetical protein [Calderihabitans maritimus]|uniref:Uncharacterized protein n=1 Tax=Calderihabitans maritimus TaxID=1246530 RepID=A0A1Z5HT93_9FIRM|nr:hypothetical protein [Calderihabitans maritimus]GAW92658.1 hypothetical protein KKC1_18090 [Calderihabitans maritimus]